MGYIRHHAIVITYSDCADNADKVIDMLRATGAQIEGPFENRVNGYLTLLVCPDGSKEGWEASADGDYQRQEVKRILSKECYEDGSSPWKWAEVQYGDDGGVSKIIAHSGDRVEA